MTILLPTHYPIPVDHPGSYWEPAEVTVTCACGAPVYEWQDGAGGALPDGWGDAWAEHLKEVDDR